MAPLFHLFVLFCRSLMKSSFVSQSPQLFPATNPSAKCCCAHDASFFICAFLESCCSCLICWATSPWACRLMDRVRQQSRVMTAIAVVFVTVWILRDSGWILHLGDLMCTQCSRPRRGANRKQFLRAESHPG